jgi:hypothetical protein
MDSSVAEGDDKVFVEGNIYLDDLMRKICKIGNFASEESGILICTSVPTHYDCVCDWVYRWIEGEVTGKPPRLLYLGYTPLFSLMAAQNTASPTGLVIEIGAAG